MRRRDIQLRAAARQGDLSAKRELGHRYLVGGDGFPKHLPTGLAYLSEVAATDLSGAAVLISETLRLEELIQLNQMDILRLSSASSAIAQLKLAAWTVATGKLAQSVHLVRCAGSGLNTDFSTIAELCSSAIDSAGLAQALIALCSLQPMNTLDVALAAARDGCNSGDLLAMSRALGAAISIRGEPDDETSALIADAIHLAEKCGLPFEGLLTEHIQASLEHLCARSDRNAWFILGKALCGIGGDGSLPPNRLVRGSNLRKGTALLVRAADAGESKAWLHLYRLNSDSRSSVANPQLARFFLEKAAAEGNSEAQRRLGALILREADSLHESEQAIGWLYQARVNGDPHAHALLASLVLPVGGTEEQAEAAMLDLQKEAPWLGARMRVSRHFGLTKLEALIVDPVVGLRDWGLVVGRNPFISQVRLSAPRAVPAVSHMAVENLRAAASLFRNAERDRLSIEGDLRHRSATQRRIFARYGIDESMFFGTASSSALDSLRIGTKWAHQWRAPLQLALAV